MIALKISNENEKTNHTSLNCDDYVDEEDKRVNSNNDDKSTDSQVEFNGVLNGNEKLFLSLNELKDGKLQGQRVFALIPVGIEDNKDGGNEVNDKYYVIDRKSDTESNTNGTSQISTEKEIEIKTYEILRKYGVPVHFNGFMYLRQAIVQAVMNPKYLHSMMKTLYPLLAEMNNSKPSRIERSIRHAIEVTWDRIDERNPIMFGGTVSNKYIKPTNAEFIATVAEEIRMKIV